MNQRFESQKNVFVQSVGVPVESTADAASDALSAEGQQAVSDYFARMERELVRRAPDGGTPLSTFERSETLREMQAHLLSLIAAYQEIGDDEQAAIASALAQFGRSGTVSAPLRRAQARNKVAGLIQKNDHLLPAVFLPAFFYNVSLLLAFLTTTTRIAGESGGQMTHATIVAFGWHVLLLLPFACGAVNANLSKKWSLLGIFIGVASVLGAITLLEAVFGNGNPSTLGAMQASLVPWLGSACLGIVFAHAAKATRPKTQTV